MSESITSVLRMWPHGSGKAEAFVNAFLSYYGKYPQLENVAPLGGRDGGRDLQSHDGTLQVACYFPIKEFKPYEDIRKKFLSDMRKAKNGGASKFVFVTGQILQRAEKEKLKAESSIADTDIFDCNDILNVVSARDAGFLRAELGIIESERSNDRKFFTSLYSKVSFSDLTHLINDSLEPKLFPYEFLEMFESVNNFKRTAQPSLLGEQFKGSYLRWVSAVDEFNNLLVDSEFFDYKNGNIVMVKLPRAKFEVVCRDVNNVFSRLIDNTTQLVGLVAEELEIPIE